MLRIFRRSGGYIKKIVKPLSHFGKHPSNRGVMCLWWVGKYMSHHFKHVTGDIRQSCTIMTNTVNVLYFLTAIHIYNKSVVTKNPRSFILADGSSL